ncbi:MAG: thioredoxin family protein [Planctomycetes bacterium]|nr:thioredoxin family protein [Planctomycetota bacterium]
MKRLALLPLLCGLAGAAGSDGWHTDFKKAAAESKKTGKPILADFTGSDWCGWCKKLDAEVFATKEFQKWARRNVVLLQLDFPHGRKLDDKLAKQNEELRDKYEVKGYPTILFLDHEGTLLGRTGYVEGGPGPWIEKAAAALPPKELWLTDFEAALARAKSEKKPILADFTGSDWCGWCIKLKDEVFSKDEFKEWAEENVVLLELDYPRKTEQPEALKKQNEDLKAKYQIRGYPTVLFLDAKGKVIGQSGYKPGGPEAWIADAKKVLKKK